MCASWSWHTKSYPQVHRRSPAPQARSHHHNLVAKPVGAPTKQLGPRTNATPTSPPPCGGKRTWPTHPRFHLPVPGREAPPLSVTFRTSKLHCSRRELTIILLFLSSPSTMIFHDQTNNPPCRLWIGHRNHFGTPEKRPRAPCPLAAYC